MDILKEKKRKEVIRELLTFVSASSDSFVVKGGAALEICYGSDRPTEDVNIDLVTTASNFDMLLSSYCKNKGYTFTSENFPLTQRYNMSYEDGSIMIEISNRRAHSFDRDFFIKLNGIWTYKISMLLSYAVLAYISKQRDHDLYDIMFICNNYWDSIDNRAKAIASEALSYNGHKPLSNLVKSDYYDIDMDRLERDYNNLYSKLQFNKLRPRIFVEVMPST